MPVFPSVDWFDAVRQVFNGDESFRTAGGGTCDATVGVVASGRAFLVQFEGLECLWARETDDDGLEGADFYLDMAPDDWREMLTNIKEHGTADLDHTLNTLDLNHPDGLAQTRNGDQYRQDLFFRYNQTFQYFFDASARIETQFS